MNFSLILLVLISIYILYRFFRENKIVILKKAFISKYDMIERTNSKRLSIIDNYGIDHKMHKVYNIVDDKETYYLITKEVSSINLKQGDIIIVNLGNNNVPYVRKIINFDENCDYILLGSVNDNETWQELFSIGKQRYFDLALLKEYPSEPY